MIKPKEITGFRIEKKTQFEMAEEEQKKAQIIAQRNFLIEKKELDLMPHRFLIEFSCKHPECRGHKISILDWEFAQLYRRVSRSDGWKAKMGEKLDQICCDKNDVCFFMGNMSSRPRTFCILGIFYPPKAVGKQLSFYRK